MTSGIKVAGIYRAYDLAIFICPLSRNSASFNLLEPKGLVQACIGITLSYEKE
jgi:hypothetical protein